jgi:uncharacterized OB-fold protein
MPDMPEARAINILRCRACTSLDPGPREFCSICGEAQMEQCAVPGQGTLVSWTVIRRPPTRFRAQGPYTIAIVDLDAGVRLTGRLVAASENVKPGVGVAFVGMGDSTYLFEERAA